MNIGLPIFYETIHKLCLGKEVFCMSENRLVAALRKKAMTLPLQPGVYIMKNAAGEIIYIGKAKALRNRVSQYFGSDTNHSEKVRQMVAHVHTFDYIVVGSEFEALVLECSLIKQHKPKYNILLKDDKGYHYIRVSPPPYSRISEAKQMADDGARYIGPYMSSYHIRQAVDEASAIFGLATCEHTLQYGKQTVRPCLNAHIHRCCAPCNGNISPEAYAERVEEAVILLTKGSTGTMALLEERMQEAADRLEFEKAARLRDRIAAIRRMSDRQRVVMSAVKEQDIVAVATGSGKSCFEVFRFTDGALREEESFLIDEQENLPAARAEFIRRYYTMRDRVPPQVTVDGETEDIPLLEQFLSEKRARRVHIVQPQIGEQAKLVAMCQHNAAERIAHRVGMTGRENAALEELRTLLALDAAPLYIECFDISHTAGDAAVAGMVVFKNGRPLKSAYRRFTVRSATLADDYAAMREVVGRRMEELKNSDTPDVGFGKKPDLILLDGGQGHVAAVKPLVDSYGLQIPVYGLVKDDRHRTRAISADGGEIAIQSKRTVFTLLSAIQEEVHRFAITYHRQKRGRSMVSTTLLQIPGIGKERARALLRQFGSVRAVAGATEEELLLVKGMTRPAAEAIVRYFREKNGESE